MLIAWYAISYQIYLDSNDTRRGVGPIIISHRVDTFHRVSLVAVSHSVDTYHRVGLVAIDYLIIFAVDQLWCLKFKAMMIDCVTIP